MAKSGEGEEEQEEYTLREDTLAALNEFLLSKNDSVAEASFPEEDWQLSQFWYSEETKKKLVDECVSAVGEDGGNIACISCPSLIPLFLQKEEVESGKVKIRLFEFDLRFQGKFLLNSEDIFVYYDYTSPLAIAPQLQQQFDLVIADPPFISAECFIKTSQTIRVLSKNKETKIIICSGSAIQDLASRLLNASITTFKPEHENNLANDFSSFTNYPPVLL
uniref:Protein-lysine N-methyltransferase n=1 Tax=Ditylenchus dipsaci TaxID=166011 RepID=A0A915CQB7_9BILA